MTIQVKWFPTLVKRTRSKQPETQAEWRQGLTPRDIFTSEGFNDTDAEAVMVLVNDEQSSMATPLEDGQRLEFMVSIQGGAD